MVVVPAAFSLITNEGYGNIPGAFGTSKITIAIDELPAAVPDTMTYFRVLDEACAENVDSAYMMIQKNIPSTEEAHQIATAYIQDHGGLPDDAVVHDIQQQYVKKMTNGQEVESLPVITEVTYRRELDGLPVVGPGDFILIGIGENGKVLCYLKTWRVLDEAGQTNILTVPGALTKLKQGNTIESPISSYEDVTVTEMHLGYYAKATGEKQHFYNPVWIFTGTDKFGGPVEVVVEATS
jgi:regulatory protein YycI of two-component signal transduction system YycFG